MNENKDKLNELGNTIGTSEELNLNEERSISDEAVGIDADNETVKAEAADETNISEAVKSEADTAQSETANIENNADTADNKTAENNVDTAQDIKAESNEKTVSGFKKPYSYKKSIAVALVGTVLCGSSLGFTLGLGLKTSDSILNGISQISRSGFSFSEKKADDNESSDSAVAASTNITTSNDDIVKVVNNVENAVVNVDITATTSSFFNQTYETTGSGSGIMYKEDDKKVYILTNNHVVEGANSCTISVTGKEKVKASLVGKDASTDIAVISVLKSDLAAAGISSPVIAKCGNSDQIEIGETVIALGNALGQGKTATVGIVSTTNKEVNIDGTKYNAIQTDAAINPGNSGGALVNTSGEIIGINSAKLASTQIEGTGYAIPINQAMQVANELIESGTVEKAYLGVSTYSITDEFKKMYQINIDGVFVTAVEEGSPADEADLQQTDIITAVDGTPVTKAEKLSEMIKAHKPGDSIKLSVIRNGSVSTEITAKLTNLNQGF